MTPVFPRIEHRALLIALLLAGLFGRTAWGCAIAPSLGSDVKIADEQAVIVWDAAHHTEHFIRGATFQTRAQDFGFLVPTPTTPTLAQGRNSAFLHLERVIQPEVKEETQTGIEWTLWLLESHSSATTAGITTAVAPPPVQVLKSQRVGDYDAVVLRADDAGALTHWLSSRGYEAQPSLRAWLAPYIARHWVITAFKIAKDASENNQASSSIVRMSFVTPQPFFPYREPADQRAPGVAYPPRLLRVFLLGPTRMQGTLGDAAGPQDWPGSVSWADRLSDADRLGLESELGLPAQTLSGAPWLTTLEDRSSPRPGTDDVFFGPSPVQSSLRPPPEIVIHDERTKIPVDILLLLVIGGVVCVRLLQRAQANKGERVS